MIMIKKKLIGYSKLTDNMTMTKRISRIAVKIIPAINFLKEKLTNWESRAVKPEICTFKPEIPIIKPKIESIEPKIPTKGANFLKKMSWTSKFWPIKLVTITDIIIVNPKITRALIKIRTLAILVKTIPFSLFDI